MTIEFRINTNNQMTEDYAFVRDDGEEINVGGRKKIENKAGGPVYKPKATT